MARLKGVYGKPWSKLVGEKVDLTPEVMNQVGVIILDSVKSEIIKAAAMARGVRGRGEPVPIPNTNEFKDSFEYSLRGARTIEISSDWPYAEVWEEGKDPYPMTWLTGRAAGAEPFPQRPGKVQSSKYAVPIVTATGKVIIRYAPFTTQDAWIHPGFARYGFLQKGIKKGRLKAAEYIIKAAVIPLLEQSDPLL